VALKRHLINFGIRHKYLSLLLILCAIWGVSAFGMYFFETTMGDSTSSYRSWGDALEAVAICLTSGFDIERPTTTGALVVALFALMCGVITVGGLIACLTSDLVNRIFFGLKIPAKPVSFKLDDHIVLFGWSDKADGIVRELHAEVLPAKKPIVIVTEQEERLPLPDATAYESVWTVYGTPTSDETLRRADVAAADTAIILADEAEADPDAKSLLICLAVETHNPRVYTCVELKDQRNRRHFDRINADELVCVCDISENLMAQMAMSKGISSVLGELLTFQVRGNELYTVPPPIAAVEQGRTFGEISEALQAHRIIAVGLQEEPAPSTGAHFADRESRLTGICRGRIVINPPHDRKVGPGEKVLVLAFSEPDLDALPPAAEASG